MFKSRNPIWFIYLVRGVEPIAHNKWVQISLQLHWDQPHVLNLTAVSPLCPLFISQGKERISQLKS